MPAYNALSGRSVERLLTLVDGVFAVAMTLLVLDLVEAGVLADRVGAEFAGVVVDVDDGDPRRGVVVVHDPDVEARVVGEEPLPLGTDVRVRLTVADVATRRVEFGLV